MMTRTERVRATLDGAETDRPPFCFWHHFRPHGSGRAMAEATIGFFDEEFDLDIAKIMPDLPYPFPKGGVRTADDWHLLMPVAPDEGIFRQRLLAIEHLRNWLGEETPIIYTVFSPLTEAIYAAGSREALKRYAADEPALVHQALSVVATNLAEFSAAAISAGADGVFLACQGASADEFSPAEYGELGRPYDLQVLRGADEGWLNILHVHGDANLMMDLFLPYPVPVINWSDRLAGPSLADVRARTDKTIMGGLHERGPLTNGSDEQIEQEMRDAIAMAGAQRFILANGCSVPDDVSHDVLRRARSVVDRL
ncbi:MAG: uroporphyrinogen decarboxylase [Chloroflexi bacterium]|nr:uroporphyrinogen decarboxylase [Chloroflexota bacterium]